MPLNELRFDLYQKVINEANFKLEEPLPTNVAAAVQHSNRIPHRLESCLVPKFISNDWEQMPQNLLKIIKCGCETGCNKRCGYQKDGLECNNLCVYCYDNC